MRFYAVAINKVNTGLYEKSGIFSYSSGTKVYWKCSKDHF